MTTINCRDLVSVAMVIINQMSIVLSIKMTIYCTLLISVVMVTMLNIMFMTTIAMATRSSTVLHSAAMVTAVELSAG